MQVLYDQLDYLLEEDEALKKLVYDTQDPFEQMDAFISPNSGPIEKQPDPNINPVITNEENAENMNSLSKNQRRRRKKQAKRHEGDQKPPTEASKSSANLPTVDGVVDDLIVISDNLDNVAVGVLSK